MIEQKFGKKRVVTETIDQNRYTITYAPDDESVNSDGMPNCVCVALLGDYAKDKKLRAAVHCFLLQIEKENREKNSNVDLNGLSI